jgi:hypothetical protein
LGLSHQQQHGYFHYPYSSPIQIQGQRFTGRGDGPYSYPAGDTPAGINGKIVDDQIVLDITGEDVHYWSPQLDFRVEEDEDLKDTTIIAGLIGPRPAVWTLFMFICFSIGFIGFFATSYGISRYMVEDFSLAIWGLPVAVLIMLTAYQAGKFGERLGAHQVEVLKQFVREAVGPALD